MSRAAFSPYPGIPYSGRLHPEDVEAIAAAVADRLTGAPQFGEYVDVAELARRLNVSTDTVYAHADAWGALRIGSGSRPLLRFDPVEVAARLSAGCSNRQSAPAADPAPAPKRRSSRRRLSGAEPALLPIRTPR